MRKLFTLMLAILLMAPAAVLAATPSLEDLQLKIKDLNDQVDFLTKQVQKNTLHSALDRITFTGDFRNKADTLHYKNVTFYPGVNVDFQDFFTKLSGGQLGSFSAFDPTNPSAILDPSRNPTALDTMFHNLYIGNSALYNQLMAAYGAFGSGANVGVGGFPLGQKRTGDIDNNVILTTRLRLNMNAKVTDNIKFMGRLTMYKNWGDSTGVKVFDSWNSFTQDGTDSGNTTGDWLRVERAFFSWHDIGGTPFYLSIGRRPSTYGPPLQYRENEPRGGTPTGHLVNFNFDGVTIGYNLTDLTGVEGMTLRFCYGQGFESEWGNGELFNDNTVNTKDTHLGGFNMDVINDGTNFLQATLFRAMDVNDGFKGLIAFPTQFAALFAPTMYQDLQKFPNFNFVTRVQPSTVIGDINLAAIGFSREEMNGVNWFTSLAGTQTKGNGRAGMFGGMMSDAVYQAELSSDGSEVIMKPAYADGDGKTTGWSVYAGIQVPAPLGKAGLEYNYGSKNWIPFTQDGDDMIGSKLGTRGHVGEAYYIFQINPKAFIKLGGLYYDYQYTGSGSPVGAPQKIKDVKNGTAFSMMPAIDTAWDGYASMTIKF